MPTSTFTFIEAQQITLSDAPTAAGHLITKAYLEAITNPLAAASHVAVTRTNTNKSVQIALSGQDISAEVNLLASFSAGQGQLAKTGAGELYAVLGLTASTAAAGNHSHVTSVLTDATTVGQNLVKLANPGAISFILVNANNTVSSRTAAQTRSDLSLVPGADVQVFSSVLSTYAGIAPSANVQTILGGATFAAIRTSLGLVIGTDVQGFNANLTTYAAIAPSANVQTILGGATFAAIRTSLGLVIGTDVQGYNANLTTYASIAPSANVQTILGGATFAAIRTSLGLVIGTDVQGYNANLTTYAAITPSANVQTILGGANFAAIRTSLGLVIGTDVEAHDPTLTGLAGKSTTGTGNIVLQSYVDNAIAGIKTKASVRAATTANGTLATAYANGQVVDGVTLATNDRVLLKNQTTQGENGIYTVNASGAPTRATDFDAWTEIPGALIAIEEGTANADALYLCSANQGGTLGTTAITFTVFNSGGLVAANNLSDLGSASTARTNLGLAIGTNVQAFSSVLSTYAGIAPSANVQTILGGATFAAIRTSLGLVIGTDVEAHDGTLTALAGKSFSGTGNIVLLSYLGTLATQNGTFSGTHSGTSSGSNTGDQTITLTGDVTGNGAGSFAATLATAQPAVHTWALAQTFTVAPLFSAMTAGSVLFTGTAGLLSQDNSNFFFDSAKKRLAIQSGTTKLSTFTVTAPGTFTATGTTSSSATTTITGSGTLFLAEIGIGDQIAISNSPSVYGTVTAIASNTSLTVDSTLGGGGSQTITVKPSAARFDYSGGTTLRVGCGITSFGANTQGTIANGLYIQGTSNAATAANSGMVQINKASNYSIFTGIFIGVDDTTATSTGQGYIQYMNGSGSSLTVGNGELLLQPRGGPLSIGNIQSGEQALNVGANGNAYIKVHDAAGYTSGTVGVVFQVAPAANSTYEKAGIFFKVTTDGGNYQRGMLCFALETTADGTNAQNNLTAATVMNIDWTAGNVAIGQGVTAGTGKFSVKATTEQVRILYDGSNYYTTTVGSGGGVTFDAVGGGAGFTFGKGVTLNGALVLPPQALSGAGAINLTTANTAFTSTGAANALTLADGTNGQVKVITHVVKGTLGTGVLTPTTKSGYTTITFNNAGDSVTLTFYTTAGWCVTGSFGAVIA